jgi:hypothetical protein
MNPRVRTNLETTKLTIERMQNFLEDAFATVIENNAWKKLANPSASRGKTALPKKPADQQRPGIRFDYAGMIEKDGTEYHKYKMQANAGNDIPTSIKNWRKANGGTHAVMAEVFVKKDGTKEDVGAGLMEAIVQVKGA